IMFLYSRPCSLLSTVTITTGGDPLGICFALLVGGLSDRPRTYRRKRKPSPISPSVLILPCRSAIMRDVLGRKGGGLELFRGGYAKCILSGGNDCQGKGGPLGGRC